MSQNICVNDDEPLFRQTGDHSAESKVKGGKDVTTLSLQEYNAHQENFRKNKVLAFCFRASIWILFFTLFLILADFFAQSKNFDSTIIKECLSLVTYIVTAALGFIFGSNQK